VLTCINQFGFIKIVFGLLVQLLTQRPTVGLYWVHGRAGMRGSAIADKLARGGYVQRFAGTESFLGV